METNKGADNKSVKGGIKMSNPPCSKCIVQASCQAKVKNNYLVIAELIRDCIYALTYVRNNDRSINKIRINKVAGVFGFTAKLKKKSRVAFQLKGTARNYPVITCMREESWTN